MKLGRTSRKNWFTNFFRDMSPTSGGSREFPLSTETTGKKELVPSWYQVGGVVFAVIGVIGTLRWLLCMTYVLDSTVPPTYDQSKHEPRQDLVYEQSTRQNSAKCDVDHVISDFTHRLQILELAFKEQVFARETIAREINDQSDIYGSLNRKLSLFLEQMSTMSAELSELEKKYRHISNRLYSDELLSMLVILVLMLEILYWGRPRVHDLINKLAAYKTALTNQQTTNTGPPPPVVNDAVDRRSTSNPGTPKHMCKLRSELCVVLLQKETTNSVLTNLTEAMLRHLDGVKLTPKPLYTVLSSDDIKSIPHVRLYVIIVDMEGKGSSANSYDKELASLTIKYTKLIGGQTIVILLNDEGSKNMTAHNMFNSSIRVVRTNDYMQDLAANGRLFSMWHEMTSHQLTHLRKVLRTVLNLKMIQIR